jgi:uncharacterized repeat protein (TIGR01451 family)
MCRNANSVRSRASSSPSSVPSGFTLRLDTDPAAAGPSTISGEATGGIDDPNLDNNQATDGFTWRPNAELSVEKSASPSTAMSGERVTYTITVTNQGPSLAKNLVLAYELPWRHHPLAQRRPRNLAPSKNSWSHAETLNWPWGLRSG